MPKMIDPNKIKVGDVVLVATRNSTTEDVQKRLGFGEASKWTHVAGSIGGHDLVEGQVPQSRVCDIQKDYIEKDFEIKVMRPRYQADAERVKVALWWATMNNLPYDFLQLAWFPAAGFIGRTLLFARNIFNSKKRLICSELLANGFYKQGYNLFDKPASNVLPADFDNQAKLDHVTDIWM